MSFFENISAALKAALLFFLLVTFPALSAAAQEKRPPVIVIPGLIGSELINQKTNEVVWFKISRSKRDDLRLPVTTDYSASRDNLVPRDILRSIDVGVKEIQIYGSLIRFLKARGYEETGWDKPKAEGAIYVFAYDWRRDNAENARLLIRKIESVKLALGQPELRFNIVAHSMGGLISRYAAMYGDRDLPAENPRPDWAGARHFNKIFLVGTPNEGSMLSLNSLVNGFSPFGVDINLPFVQNITRFDVFTIPSIYQLLPRTGTIRAFDENLRPLEIDIFDPATWEKYGWNPTTDKKFASQFTAAERPYAKDFFLSALTRAKRFQAALAAPTGGASAAKFILVGAECRETLDGLVIRRAKNGWTTVFKPEGFRRADGRQVTSAELKKLLFTPGDGIVTKRSLTAGGNSSWQTSFKCEEHNFLMNNQLIQGELLTMLEGK